MPNCYTTSLLRFIKTKHLTVILNYLTILKKANKLHELSKTMTNNGNSFLHLAVIYQDPDDLKKIINLLGDAILEMHLITNHEGYTAMALTEFIPDPTKRNRIQNLLLTTALEATKRSFNDDPEPLDYTEILTQYCIPEHSKLAQNIKRGCDAVNYCKSIGLQSDTHPRTNESNRTEFLKICRRIENFREHVPDNISFQTYSNLLEKNGYGNCTEYARLAAFYLSSCRKNYNHKFAHVNHMDFLIMNVPDDIDLKDPSTYGIDASLVYLKDCSSFSSSQPQLLSNCSFNPTIYAFFGKQTRNNFNLDSWQIDLLANCGHQKLEYKVGIAEIENGDHVVAVIDGHFGDDFNHLSKNTVIVDAWANKVYPATQIQKNLMNLYTVSINNITYNFLAHVNPHIHQLKTSRILHASPDKVALENNYLNSDAYARSLACHTNQPVQIWNNKDNFFSYFSSIETLCDHIKNHEVQSNEPSNPSLSRSRFGTFKPPTGRRAALCPPYADPSPIQFQHF